MSEAWDLAELRSHIRDIGRDDASHLVDAVNSVDRSIQIFSYHLYTARDALNGFIDKSNPLAVKHFELISGISDVQKEYELAKLAHEANLIACIHAARSMFDIFSHLANGLLLAPQIPVGACDIYKVTKRLPQSALSRCLNELIESDWFNYVVGFINTTKHRQLIKHQFTISFVDSEVGIQIGAFEYRGRSHPIYRGEDVLRGVLVVKNSIVECGQALNKLCIEEHA